MSGDTILNKRSPSVARWRQGQIRHVLILSVLKIGIHTMNLLLNSIILQLPAAREVRWKLPCTMLLLSLPLVALDKAEAQQSALLIPNGIYAMKPEFCKMSREAVIAIDEIGIIVINGSTVTYYESECRVRNVRVNGTRLTFSEVCNSEGQRNAGSVSWQLLPSFGFRRFGVSYQYCGALGTTAPSPPANLPQRIGQCVETQITKITDRFGDELKIDGENTGSSVHLANGGFQTSYDKESALLRARVGDRVRMCLASAPQNCPPGDDRGRQYITTNLRTGEAWRLPDSQHGCGGA